MGAGANGDVQQNEDSATKDGESARAIGELQAKLQATEIELERAKTQRDYVLRLLQQQQTLSTSGIQNFAFAFHMEQNSALAGLLGRVPRNVKDLFPARFRQFVKNIAIKVG